MYVPFISLLPALRTQSLVFGIINVVLVTVGDGVGVMVNVGVGVGVVMLEKLAKSANTSLSLIAQSNVFTPAINPSNPSILKKSFALSVAPMANGVFEMPFKSN